MVGGGSNFKTKQETEDKKGVYSAVVGGLLVISFVVPMVQYFGYVNVGSDEVEDVPVRGKGKAPPPKRR